MGGAIRREDLARYERSTGESVHIDARQSSTVRDISVYVWIDGYLARTDAVRTWDAARKWAADYRRDDATPYGEPAQ